MTLLGISPYLYYADAAAALEWLDRVFGFGPSQRMADADGTVQEAEIEVGQGKVMISGRGPGEHEGAGSLVVHMDDVDALHEQVGTAGVDAEPPQGRAVRAADLQRHRSLGNRWFFWQGDAT